MLTSMRTRHLILGSSATRGSADAGPRVSPARNSHSIVVGREPLVSVLTPSLNQARWLPDCLRSVAAQDYPNLEQIVMDGGSTDGSVEYLETFESDRLRWSSQPDRGLAHALNKAFKEGKGEIVGILASDDAYFSATSVRTVVDEFARHPEAIVVYGHALAINASGLVLQAMWTPGYSAALIRRSDYITAPTAFIRRSALQGVFIDDDFRVTMDAELWTRLSFKGTFVRASDILAVDRHHLARKSIAEADVAAAEGDRIAKRYGVSREGSRSVLGRIRRFGYRVRGVPLLLRARKAPVVFARRTDGLPRALLRQLVVPRSMMSSE
jgi:glycosyltransferase involved in cell wall biosynthesis